MDEIIKKKRIPVPIVGILAPIIYSNIGHILGIWRSQWMLAILIVIYIGVGIYIWQRPAKSMWKNFFVVLLLMPVGVVIDVNIDWFLRHFDRNLFRHL